MNRHKRSHYKSKSKLFLFGDLNPSQAQEPTDLDPNMLVSPLEQALTPQISILNSSELVTIPVSVEAHHFIDSQVPTNNMQQEQEQQLPLASFEITAAGTLSGGVTATLADGTPLYVLDSKLLIPQTIMQHQQEEEGSPPGEMVLGAEMQQQQQLP